MTEVIYYPQVDGITPTVISTRSSNRTYNQVCNGNCSTCSNVVMTVNPRGGYTYRCSRKDVAFK